MQSGVWMTQNSAIHLIRDTFACVRIGTGMADADHQDPILTADPDLAAEAGL